MSADTVTVNAFRQSRALPQEKRNYSLCSAKMRPPCHHHNSSFSECRCRPIEDDDDEEEMKEIERLEKEPPKTNEEISSPREPLRMVCGVRSEDIIKSNQNMGFLPVVLQTHRSTPSTPVKNFNSSKTSNNNNNVYHNESGVTSPLNVPPPYRHNSNRNNSHHKSREADAKFDPQRIIYSEDEMRSDDNDDEAALNQNSKLKFRKLGIINNNNANNYKKLPSPLLLPIASDHATSVDSNNSNSNRSNSEKEAFMRNIQQISVTLREQLRLLAEESARDDRPPPQKNNHNEMSSLLFIHQLSGEDKMVIGDFLSQVKQFQESAAMDEKLKTVSGSWELLKKKKEDISSEEHNFREVFYNNLLLWMPDLQEQTLLIADENENSKEVQSEKETPLFEGKMFKDAAQHYWQLLDDSIELYQKCFPRLSLPTDETNNNNNNKTPYLTPVAPNIYASPSHHLQQRLRTEWMTYAVKWCRYGMREDVYFTLRDCVVRSLAQCLPGMVWGLCKEDWSHFFQLWCTTLSDGTRSPEGQRALDRHTERVQSNIYSSLCKLQCVPSDKSIFREVFRLLAESPDAPQEDQEGYSKAARRFSGFSPSASLSTENALDQAMWESILHLALMSPREQEFNEACLAVAEQHLQLRILPHQMDHMLPVFLDVCQSTFHLYEPFDPLAKLQAVHFLERTFRQVAKMMRHLREDPEGSRSLFAVTTSVPTFPLDASEPFCLLFTDIESSTNLWQRFPAVMKEAVERHHRIIRTVIADNGGYEVKTVGDSFIIAAKDVFVGMKIAVGIQLELMRHLPIAPGFEMLEEVQGGGDPNAWSNQTLRVRIGIEHCTQATATYDTIHRRYDYYGPSVNQCARIEAAAAGGQILMSRETFKALKAVPAFHDEPCPAHLRDVSGDSAADERGLDHFVAMCDVGKVKLKGIKKPVQLFSIAPMCFAGRQFNFPEDEV
ncbi:Adenylate and Guanylate cyclase catalytic domain containing protein, putative [Angomonas deanei]|uniref:Adenylate and Guanylate cyclase catalytic domain containing protein, putative n=1 Tax=Angomonas deanei TaxID=59799 RepID=A0A7G2CV28_9TRYP|nr:Adenylate and Guanylate cyclase catalytic domain containing protein, putative [Angomonas deanei]